MLKLSFSQSDLLDNLYKCHLQYVGETVQTLNEGINGHETGLDILQNMDTVKFFVSILLLEGVMEPNIKFK